MATVIAYDFEDGKPVAWSTLHASATKEFALVHLHLLGLWIRISLPLSGTPVWTRKACDYSGPWISLRIETLLLSRKPVDYQSFGDLSWAGILQRVDILEQILLTRLFFSVRICVRIQVGIPAHLGIYASKGSGPWLVDWSSGLDFWQRKIQYPALFEMQLGY